jgi:hypothetical protein
MCNNVKTGRYSVWVSTVAGHVGHQACPLQMMCIVQTGSAADVARELDIHWVVHRIVWDLLYYREVCEHWVPNNPTDFKLKS